jgi:hypothetical protein
VATNAMMMSSEAPRNPFSVFIWISPSLVMRRSIAYVRSLRRAANGNAASAGTARLHGMSDTDHSGCTSKEFEVTPTRLVVPSAQ